MPDTADLLLLLTALLLPWLGGCFWVALLGAGDSSTPGSLPVRMGYGLFLGYAGVQATVLAWNAVAGSLDFWPIFLVQVCITLAGAGLWWWRRPRPAQQAIASDATPRFARILFWFFAVWALLHLAFAAIEIVHRPIFPWDAWFNWLYRAKAWYLSGELFLMDAPIDWLRGEANAAYNVAGNEYPTFSPVMGLWAAMALGQWSETLVNLPVLFCGIALGLAIYGQTRQLGLPAWAAAMCSYLLLSIPLVGTHLSLAGKADIWMAGFTGLGFVALLRGLIEQKTKQLLLGLGMVALGIATKAEGSVWFFAALLMCGLVLHPRITLACCVLATLTATLGVLMKVTYVDLPVLGGIGIADNRLHIPLLGSYGILHFELLDDYRDNFFASGTWHLLWPFIFLAIITASIQGNIRVRWTLLAFFAVLAATQFVIFEGTEQGQWAEDWTAINRLPLHFAPALVFSFFVIARHTELPSLASVHAATLKVPVAALGMAMLLGVIFLTIRYPGDGGKPVVFPAESMQIRIGDGVLEAGVGRITRFDNNIAIISSHPITVDAAQMPVLEVETRGDNTKRATFFWRRMQDSAELYSINIPARGRDYVDLSTAPDWSGIIT
ncbi:hypothetical protein N9M39_01295, partial [Halieaceae bacterium]|nr:hypothetical protein [Halieaceae bacterium]